MPLVVPSAPPRRAATDSTGTPNLTHVTNLAYELRHGQTLPSGTDLELVTIGARKYALAGTYRNGLQIIDVTNPARPSLTAVYDCAIAQGDVQVFRQGSRTLATYTADDFPQLTTTSSGCYRELAINSARPYGTFIIDVTNPRAPKGVSFVPVAAGSHNQSVHPNGKFLYNSNADLNSLGALEVYDISDLAHPRQAVTLPLGPGLNAHDVTFSTDGTRAYVAALTHTLILDTTNPARPTVLGRILDPAVNLHHQADPITLSDPGIGGGQRTFLVVSDELAGAAGNGFCPGGGLHVYDVTGSRERLPVKVGFFDIPELRPTTGSSLRCTSHVLRMYPEHKLMTIAWYAGGVRVIDVSGLVGISAGTPIDRGMREVGYRWFSDSETWSAKAYHIEPDGSFYLFANDIKRGFDVFHFRRPAAGSAGLGAGQATGGLAGLPKAPEINAPTVNTGTGTDGGRWLSPEQALTLARTRSAMPVSASNKPFCVIN